MALLLLLVALSCGQGRGSTLRRALWYHLHPETWGGARSICDRDHGGDLLTALSRTEMDLVNMSSFQAWIGIVAHDSHHHWVHDKGDHSPGHWPYGQGDNCAYATHQDNSIHFDDCAQRHFSLCTGSLSAVFVPQTRTWDQAYDFCKTGSQELLTFPDENLLSPGSPLYLTREFPVWIGLHGDGGVWSWGDGQQSDYRNWAPGSQSKSMSVHSCSDAFPFLCYNPSLVLLQEHLTWEQAEGRCKTLSSSSSFRLLSADQSRMEDTKNVLRFAQTDKVWVGLRFLAGSWFRLDNVPVYPPLPPCPGTTLRCGALVLNTRSIEATDCREKLNFLCAGTYQG